MNFFSVLGRRSLRTVPSHIRAPSYAATGEVEPTPQHIVLQTKQGIEALWRAGALARSMLELTCSLAKPGVTTNEIDAVVHEAILDKGAYPAPLNYRGFPKSVCAAVNEEICHAIPDDRPLKAGDIAKFDVSIYTDEGYFGDNCATVVVGGDVDARGQQLVHVTAECLTAAIAQCQVGGCLTDVGAAIHDIADKNGLESVDRFCGHGIGRGFHMQPMVQHYRNRDACRFRPGMVFTIEPMLVEGSKACKVLDNGWTVVTTDGSRAAQFEHMVAITDDGPLVLTAGTQEGNPLALPF